MAKRNKTADVLAFLRERGKITSDEMRDRFDISDHARIIRNVRAELQFTGYGILVRRYHDAQPDGTIKHYTEYELRKASKPAR